MLFDSQMLDGLGIELLPRKESFSKSIEEIHNSPLSLLEPYKHQGFDFCDTENDFQTIIFQNEEFQLFGKNIGGLYLLRRNEVLFLKTQEGTLEFCNSSLRNFCAIYCYVIGLAFSLKSHLINKELDLQPLFEEGAERIEKYYNDVEGAAIAHSHWELIRYEFEEGFFPLKPSLGYFVQQGITMFDEGA